MQQKKFDRQILRQHKELQINTIDRIKTTKKNLEPTTNLDKNLHNDSIFQFDGLKFNVEKAT